MLSSLPSKYLFTLAGALLFDGVGVTAADASVGFAERDGIVVCGLVVVAFAVA